MSEALQTAFNTAVTGIKTDVLQMITVALPAGLSIMGIGVAVNIGVRFFKSVAH